MKARKGTRCIQKCGHQTGLETCALWGTSTDVMWNNVEKRGCRIHDDMQQNVGFRASRNVGGQCPTIMIRGPCPLIMINMASTTSLLVLPVLSHDTLRSYEQILRRENLVPLHKLKKSGVACSDPEGAWQAIEACYKDMHVVFVTLRFEVHTSEFEM